MNQAQADRRSLWINARLATMDPSRPAPYGALEGHALLLEAGRIAALLPAADIDPASFDGVVIDAKGAWITPGFIDCHTHLVYGGNRAAEWEKAPQWRALSADRRRGRRHRLHRARHPGAGRSRPGRRRQPRLRALMAEGVTTVEIKSGYGLSLEDELKQLRGAALAG